MVRQAPVKAHGMSEAARKAELLFETSTVAEIREVGGANLQNYNDEPRNSSRFEHEFAH
jgi:hypothetical protein